MKKILIIPIVLLLSFCNSKKTIVEKIAEKTTKPNCPVYGKCPVVIFRNKQLDLKVDQFGSTYYQISEAESTSVILYRYKKNSIKNVQDASYTEEIIFEISNSDYNLSLTDIDLQQTKMIFGRLCFCRGQTGYYKVKTGNLKLIRNKNEIQFYLNFKISQFPQIINSVSKIVK